jgi:hypothetical protein
MHDSEEARHSAAAVAAAADSSSSSSGEARDRRQSTAAVSDSSSSTTATATDGDSSASAQQLAAVRKQYEKKLQEHEQQRSRLTADLEVRVLCLHCFFLYVCPASASIAMQPVLDGAHLTCLWYVDSSQQGLLGGKLHNDAQILLSFLCTFVWR